MMLMETIFGDFENNCTSLTNEGKKKKKKHKMKGRKGGRKNMDFFVNQVQVSSMTDFFSLGNSSFYFCMCKLERMLWC